MWLTFRYQPLIDKLSNTAVSSDGKLPAFLARHWPRSLWWWCWRVARSRRMKVETSNSWVNEKYIEYLPSSSLTTSVHAFSKELSSYSLAPQSFPEAYEELRKYVITVASTCSSVYTDLWMHLRKLQDIIKTQLQLLAACKRIFKK